MTLRIPRELISPNRWQGRHWRTKHRLSQAWERDVWAAILTSGARSAWQAPGRKRVAVTRLVPNRRRFIKDDDNLLFCVKPMLDALKRLKVIVNDSRAWIELPLPMQDVSWDGQCWTVIQVSDLPLVETPQARKMRLVRMVMGGEVQEPDTGESEQA